MLFDPTVSVQQNRPLRAGDPALGNPFEGSDDLVEIFPNMLSGPAFIAHALAAIEDTPAFGVVVVRLDHDHGEDGSAHG